MDDVARKILNVIEGGDIELVCVDGIYHVLIELKPVLSFSTKPGCGVTDDHKVWIANGRDDITLLQADNAEDAENIADALSFCFSTCKEQEQP